MEYDETKKLEVEISQNQYVENQIDAKRKKRKGTLDALDVAIIPVAIGVFVSLGFFVCRHFQGDFNRSDACRIVKLHFAYLTKTALYPYENQG